MSTTGYEQYCPIAVAAEILSERWTPLVLRALCQGATRYAEIRESVPRMSTALLSKRLGQLEHAGVIAKRPAGRGHEYRLTDAGAALFPVLEAMGDWAQDWLRPEITRPENLDPYLLMWEIRRAVRAGPPPARRRVAHFRLEGTAPAKRLYWLIFDAGDVDICTRDPGFEVDLWVSAHIRTLVEIWLGHRGFEAAIDDGSVALDGAGEERRAFRDWFRLSHFAGRTAPAAQDRM